MNKNPVLEQIEHKQAKINEEVRLRPKKQTVNGLVIGTSLLLLTGVLIGLIRILSSVLH